MTHDVPGDDVDEQYDDGLEGVVVTGETLLTEADYLATWDAVPQFGAFKSVRVLLAVAALAGLPSLHFFGGSPVAWPVVVFPVLLVASAHFRIRARQASIRAQRSQRHGRRTDQLPRFGRGLCGANAARQE